jgi:hypothetical protein
MIVNVLDRCRRAVSDEVERRPVRQRNRLVSAVGHDERSAW